MRLDDIVTDTIPVAHHLREYFAKRGKDAPNLITCYRGEEEVARVIAAGDSSLAMPVTDWAVTGFDADVVTLVMDSWTTGCTQDHTREDWEALHDTTCAHMLNPTTGKPWKPGELDKVATEHDGVAKGWIQETLMLHAANRAGDMRSLYLPYRLTGVKRDLVVWDATREFDLEKGYIPESLVQSMNGPGATVLLEKAHGYPIDPMDEGWSREARDAYTASIIQSIYGDKVHVAVSSNPDDAARMERLRKYGNLG